jgi:hypothetical protein
MATYKRKMKNLKPNTLIIGAAKAGTTALYDYMKQHPQVFFTKEKEPHFFDNDHSFAKGENWYLKKYFSGADDFTIRAEATPGYMRKYQKVIPRFKQFFKDESPKMLVVLRDPVKRAWSHYQHMYRNNEEVETYENALLLERARLRNDPESWYGYYNDGLYSKQINAWFDAFPKENFHFLLSDDLYTNHLNALEGVCDFLEIDSEHFKPEMLVSNQASQPRSKALMKLITNDNPLKSMAGMLIKNDYLKRGIIKRIRRANLKPGNTPKMSKENELTLRQHYQEELDILENLINIDLSRWKL